MYEVKNSIEIVKSSAKKIKMATDEKTDTILIEDDEKLVKSEPQKMPDDDICELEHLRKLFIGGLAPYTTEEGLKEFYGQWGKVVDVVVMRDPTTKRSRGFGFITFTKSSMVDKAQENRPHVIDGKTVEAKRALPRPERESRETNISVKKLFVGGLKDNHDEECLKEYFSQFGNVVSVKILTDKTTGKRRGFAFIEFDDYDAVDKAILQKNHSIKYVIVDVKKSVYNQEKQQRQNNANAAASNNGNQAKQPPPPPAAANAAGAPPPPGYRPPPQQQSMPPYQQPPPMQPAPMPPNYNYWGPPPPTAAPPQYGANPYQAPPPPNMNGWNYPSAPNGWNAGPPPPPAGAAPPSNWYPNQWGPPLPGQQPPIGPPAAVPPPTNWNTAPVPPPNAPAGAPTQPPPQQAPPNNFGTGYQQNYGGGPTKHNSVNSNRMNPYSGGPHNNYASNGQPPAASYGAYNGNNKPAGNVPPVANGSGGISQPISNGSATMSPSANKYRR